MSINETATKATIIATAALTLYAVYRLIVPSHQAELGSLASVKPKVRHLVEKHYPIAPDSKMAPSKLGPTYYRILGNSTGERIILIHGISGTWASMPQVLDSLVSRGYQVCVYDVYGRGYSASPGVKYDHVTYTQQLLDLMNHISWPRANILGYSMGGGIATYFAAAHPERVDRLVLVAPAGLREDLPFAGKIVGAPVIGPLFSNTIGRKYLLGRSTAGYVNGPYGKEPHMLHFAEVQELNILHNPGFIRAYSSTVSDGPIWGAHGAYERVGKLLGNRVLCVWGTEDTTTSYETEMPHFKRLMPNAKIVEVEGAGHSFLPETCEVVLEPVAAFLKERQ
ncbi:hypothetical protein HDU79_000293 [Rhizoclosmatium sp. JEL0117]|nr:hypothetical protein HDU79_000293 [Rhizoclosmatium sp. JEL0117]